MEEIDRLLNEIDKLRDRLLELIINKNENLTDKDVIETSEKLNVSLNQYNKFLDEKMKK